MLELKLGVKVKLWIKLGVKLGTKNSVMAFLKCMDGSILAFLKCVDGSVLVSQKSWTVLYRPTSGFPSNLPPLDFHSRGIPVYHSYYERKALKCHIWNRMYSIIHCTRGQERPFRRKSMHCTTYCLLYQNISSIIKTTPVQFSPAIFHILPVLDPLLYWQWLGQTSRLAKRRTSEISHRFCYLKAFKMAYFTLMVLLICLVQERLYWILKPNNQWDMFQAQAEEPRKC